MVVVSIILLIVGIGTVAAVKIATEARRDQTLRMMQGLMGANEEYKANSGADLNHDGGTPIDWSSSNFLSSSERFVSGMSRVPAAETMLNAAISQATSESTQRIFNDSDNDNTNGIFDRWGTELEYRAYNDGSGSGPSTNIQNRLLPIHRSAFFVSAGPDQTFGTDDDITTIEGELIYSP